MFFYRQLVVERVWIFKTENTKCTIPNLFLFWKFILFLPFDFVGADHCFIIILNLPINVVSDGLHSQKQWIMIPSVGGSSSKQVYHFFICLVGGFDCVCEKVDAIDFNQRCYLKPIKVVLWTCMASAFSQMQLLGILWQMKKWYSCWPFWFCVSRPLLYWNLKC